MFILRDIKYNDYKELYECGKDTEAKKFYDPKVFESLESIETYFNNYFLKLKEQTGIAAQIIELNNKIIGFIYFCYVKEKDNERVAELGYVLHKDYRKKGIMTKAIKELVTRGFKELTLDVIQISCYPNNLGSIKLAERLGMKYICQWYDENDTNPIKKPINLYGITRDEFFKQEICYDN